MLLAAINRHPFAGRTTPAAEEERSDADESTPPWSTLPQDLLIHVAAQLVEADDLLALARLAQTCSSASSGLAGVLKERQLRWCPEYSGCCVINGQTIECTGPFSPISNPGSRLPWAAGSALPRHSSSSGSSRLGFRATGVKEHSWIGICAGEAGSAPPIYAWAIRPIPQRELRLYRFDHDANSGLFRLGGVRRALPADYAVLCRDAQGNAPRVEGGGTTASSEEDGAVVDVIVDMAARSLSFRINNGPILSGLSGLPAGLELRPWASTFGGAGEHEGSSVTLSRRLTRLE